MDTLACSVSFSSFKGGCNNSKLLFFKWPLEMHGVSKPEKWSWLKLCCLFLTRLMVRAQWEWTLFHLKQQLSWCANIWHAHNRFPFFVVFRKAKSKPSPVLHPCEMRWWVMPQSCCAGIIKSANFKLSSLQVNACNIPLSHVFHAFFVIATEQHWGKAPNSRYLLFVPIPAVTPSVTLDQVLPLCALTSTHV